MKYLCTALLLAVSVTSGFAQTKKSSQQRVVPSGKRSDPTIYPLKNADASSLVKIARETYPDLRVSADVRTNSVIVSGSKTDVMEFRKLLLEIELNAKNAQEKANKSEATAKSPDIKVFALQYSRASVVETVVKEIFPGVKVTAELATNTLIASGTETELKIVEALLLRLDKSSEQDSRVVMFRVRSDVESMAKTISGLVNVRMSVDVARSMILVSGTKKETDEVSDLLEALDRPVERKATTKPLKLRVLWLSSDTENTKPLTKDLTPIVGPLAKVGITDLRIMSQMLVDASEVNGRFSLRGAVRDNAMTVSGSRESADAKPARFQMTIEIAPAQRIDAPVIVESSVALSPGQMLVLGATPMGRTNAVFVVQLVEGL